MIRIKTTGGEIPCHDNGPHTTAAERQTEAERQAEAERDKSRPYGCCSR